MSQEVTKPTEYLPIHGTELVQMQFFYSLYRCLADDDSMKPRLSALGLWWRYRGLLKQAHSLFDAAWHTIDPEKRNRLNTIWSQQELRVVNSSQAVDPTGDMVMVPKRAILLMGQHCQAESCAICMGSHADRKDCLFRRGMVALSLPDLRKIEKESGKCMGKLFDWSEQ